MLHIMLHLLSNSDCEVNLNIDNIRSSNGVVYLFVYNYENQYPDNPFQYFCISKNDLYEGEIKYRLEGLEAGSYGFVIFDDENGNEDFDRFFGLPKEGYGFSNNAKTGLMGLPKYEKILVTISRPKQELNLKMKYLF